MTGIINKIKDEFNGRKIITTAATVIAAGTALAIGGIIIAGPWIIILVLRFGIWQFEKFGRFLQVMHNPDTPKHSMKTMVYSFITYSICLLGLTLCTFNILIFPMILIWGYASLFIYEYIKLWKYHGYSVPLFVVLSFAVITGSAVTSPFMRSGISHIITVVLP
ncbi:MAG: hypothetical protein FWH24_02590 [Oscillospiraceae bacterium]|nr:hypothetical protein [Oscillospiraceae bacterium]